MLSGFQPFILSGRISIFTQASRCSFFVFPYWQPQVAFSPIETSNSIATHHIVASPQIGREKTLTFQDTRHASWEALDYKGI